MKSANVIWTILGVVILLLIIGYFTSWFGLKKPVTQSGIKEAPKCMHEYPDGSTVIYPCGTVPPPPQVQRLVYVTNGGGRNVLNSELV